MPKSTTTSSAAATVVRPQDYADSPVHYAVATGDHATLTKLLSSLPKLSDPSRIHTESESLAEERVAKQISATVDGRENSLRETALHLAVRLNDVAAARRLAEAGANIDLSNSAGWDPLQEAILHRCKEIIPVLAQKRNLTTWSKWRRRFPRLLAALRRMRDFYMEISFHFESILPFVSKVAPSDTYKIWKRAGNLRADFSMIGYEGLNIKRSNQSILFLNDIDENDAVDVDIPQGSLLILNHEKKKIYVATFEDGGKPLSDVQLSKYCNRTKVYRSKMEVSKAELIGCKNWRRQQRTESVGEWKARVYEMHNVILNLSNCKVNDSEPCTADRPAAPRQITKEEFSKSFKPMIWLTEEFPLKTEELHRLLDILSKKIKAVRRLKEMLKTALPPGTFPVKVSIPVVPAVRVVITFTKFVELQQIDEDFHTPPSSPTHLANEQGCEESTSVDHRGYLSLSSLRLKGHNRHKQNSSSGGQAIEDPFEIPSGYTWIKISDEKNRKTK